MTVNPVLNESTAAPVLARVSRHGTSKKNASNDQETSYIGKKGSYKKIDEELKGVKDKTAKNWKMKENYEQLYSDTGEIYPSLLKHSGNVASCCSMVWFDKYHKQKINDFQNMNPCHDRFCPYCQAKDSQKRKKKFMPMIEDLRNKYSAWMFVLTVPNCSTENLKETTDKMIKAHRNLALYLCGAKKIRGIDLSEYGIVGGLRNYELTASEEKGCHPHFHDVILADKNFKPNRISINDFSYSNGKFVRKFCELEILIQKIWYLLYNDIRVTKRNIDSLQQGYSVIIKRCESERSLNECFKYALKGAFSKHGDYISDYEYFKSVFMALTTFSGNRMSGKRLFQGFGILYNIGESYCEEAEIEAMETYQEQLDTLYKVEEPEKHSATIDDYIDKEAQTLTFGKRFIRSDTYNRYKEQGKLKLKYVSRKDYKKIIAAICNPIIEKHEAIRKGYKECRKRKEKLIKLPPSIHTPFDNYAFTIDDFIAECKAGKYNSVPNGGYANGFYYRME